MDSERHQRLRTIAMRAVAAIERAGQGAGSSDLEALRRFDPAAAAQPESDLYLRLRDLEHACGAHDPALGRLLRRFGCLVERGG